MVRRINYVIDRFETALVKLQNGGETGSDFLSVLKGAIDYSTRMYSDVGRLQFQRELEQVSLSVSVRGVGVESEEAQTGNSTR